METPVKKGLPRYRLHRHELFTAGRRGIMDYLDHVKDAFQRNLLSIETFHRLSTWLTDDEFAPFRSEIHSLIDRREWEELDDRFYTIIEFGTGGRRGSRGAGSNRINSRTIAESAQGLASYIFENGDPSRGVAVTFDTRHKSENFARTVCEVLAGNAIPSFIYASPRSTPQLSFTIRHLKAQAGCMISASHNPPSDNGIKVSWEDGGQVIPPHDKGIIRKVMETARIHRKDFDSGVKEGLISFLGDEVDNAYLAALETVSLSERRNARVVFSPLHGVGATNVVSLLQRLKYTVTTVPEQMIPDPDFSTVKNRLPNPELPAAMEKVTALAAEIHADLALASDPDADRIGATIPCPSWRDPSGWLFLNGNQIGALILDHVINRLEQTHAMPARPVVIKTIVTTELLNAICEKHGIDIIDDLLVGFKYIAETIACLPADKTPIFQTEESHGYNRGLFVRDKDAAPAALHLAELASELKAENRTVFDKLMDLYRTYGLYVEHTRSVFYPGQSGREKMNRIMEILRNNPPDTIRNRPVHHTIDRASNMIKNSRGIIIGTIQQHTGNVMQFCFDADGINRLTARPSGTEPKIKFYAQLRETLPESITDPDIETRRRSLVAEADHLIDLLATAGGN
jgi:phosphoglucomutase